VTAHLHQFSERMSVTTKEFTRCNRFVIGERIAGIAHGL
jgi:hypothetical protein